MPTQNKQGHTEPNGVPPTPQQGLSIHISMKEVRVVHDKQELCDKIREIYPEIGECDINIDTEWDEEKKVWVVDLEKGGKELKTFLEPEDADNCIQGKQCVSLGLQIAQLKSNIENLPQK